MPVHFDIDIVSMELNREALFPEIERAKVSIDETSYFKISLLPCMVQMAGTTQTVSPSFSKSVNAPDDSKHVTSDVVNWLIGLPWIAELYHQPTI